MSNCLSLISSMAFTTLTYLKGHIGLGKIVEGSALSPLAGDETGVNSSIASIAGTSWWRTSKDAGIGVVDSRAVRVKQFRFRGKPVRPSQLQRPKLFEQADDPELAHYLVAIRWKKTVPRAEAKFRPNAKLYTPRRVVASLAHQPKTRKFVEEAFDISLDELAAGNAAIRKRPYR
jgi:hypothetical protein